MRRVSSALRRTTTASATARTGSVSPAGEALATLPPIVPRFWICTPPISRAAAGGEGKPLREQGGAEDVPVGGRRPDRKRALANLDPAQLGDWEEIDEP